MSKENSSDNSKSENLKRGLTINSKYKKQHQSDLTKSLASNSQYPAQIIDKFMMRNSGGGETSSFTQINTIQEESEDMRYQDNSDAAFVLKN